MGQTWSGRAGTVPAVAGWKITAVEQVVAVGPGTTAVERQRWATTVLAQSTCVEAMPVRLVAAAEEHERQGSVPTVLRAMQGPEGLRAIHESIALQEPTECASGLEEGAMHVWGGCFVPLGQLEMEQG